MARFLHVIQGNGAKHHEFSLVKCHNIATRSGLRDRIKVMAVMAVALDIYIYDMYSVYLEPIKKTLYFEGSNIQQKVLDEINTKGSLIWFKPFLVHVGRLMRPTLSQLSHTHRAPQNQQLHA